MYIFQYVAAFLLSAGLVHFFRLPAEKVGLVDNPGGRKQHVGAVPLVGGIAIFAAFVFAALFLPIPLRPYASLFLGMALLLTVGVMDDLHSLAPKAKLVAQLLAAALMVFWGDVMVISLGNIYSAGEVVLGLWGIPFTLICVVGLINAVNMIDGMDGLAGGVVLIMGSWMALAAVLNGDMLDTTVLILLLSAVLGFLLFNYRHPWLQRAHAFMGDAGSMLLGFAMAWFAVRISQADSSALSPISLAWILALPVFDTITVMLRRIMKHKSPFEADRDHLHHIFMKAGLSDRAAVNLLLLWVLSMGAIGVGGWHFGVPEILLLIGLVFAFLLYLYFVLHAWKTMKAIKRLLHRSNAP